MTMIRIKGGPTAIDMKLFKVQDDGTEVEITNVAKLEISPFIAGEAITVKATFMNVELDLDLEGELIEVGG